MNYEYRIIETKQSPSWQYKIGFWDSKRPSWKRKKRPELYYIAQYRIPKAKHWWSRENKWLPIYFNSFSCIDYLNNNVDINGYQYEEDEFYCASIDMAKEVIRQHKEYFKDREQSGDKVVYEERAAQAMTKTDIINIINQYTKLLEEK